MSPSNLTVELHKALDIITELAEDLSIELLSEFDDDEFKHLGKSTARLHRAVDILSSNGRVPPMEALEVLRKSSL